MRGRKEVQPQHIRRARGARSDLAHVQIGRVGGKDCPGFADTVEFRKYGFLDSHLLENGLDHQIDLPKRAVVCDHVQGLVQDRCVLRVRYLAALQGTGQVALDPPACGFACLGTHFQKRHRQACQQGRCGDARAHGATADHAKAFHRARRDTFQFGQVRYGAFAEEGMDHALALVRLHQIHEDLPFCRKALGKGFFDRSLHSPHAPGRRNLPAPFCQHRLERGIPVDRGRWRHLGNGATGCPCRQQFLRIGKAQFLRVAVAHHVDDAQLQRLCCAHMTPCGHDLQPGFDACDPRQALRAARPGDQAQMHFGQAHTCGRHGQAVVTTKRHFQPATKADPMHGRHDQKGRALDPVDEIGQPGFQRGLAEFLDISACEKGPAFADDQHRAHAVIRLGLLHAVPKTLTHGLRERVDRRVAYAQHRNIAHAVVTDLVAHRCPPVALLNKGPGLSVSRRCAIATGA